MRQPAESSRFQRGFPALQPRPITATERRAAQSRAVIADAIIAYASLASIIFQSESHVLQSVLQTQIHAFTRTDGFNRRNFNDHSLHDHIIRTLYTFFFRFYHFRTDFSLQMRNYYIKLVNCSSKDLYYRRLL